MRIQTLIGSVAHLCLSVVDRYGYHVAALHTAATIKKSYPEIESMKIHTYGEVGSTMDVAKDLLRDMMGAALEGSKPGSFAVVANSQSKGRGTRGRTWISTVGNLFLTVVIPISDISIPLTLIPLRIGTLLLPVLQSKLPASVSESTKLKWPNDVLIDGKKVSGMLMEMDGDYLFVGIGCNVVVAPFVESAGENAGRPSTALSAFIGLEMDASATGDAAESEKASIPAMTSEIARDVVDRISYWIANPDSEDSVIADYSASLDWSTQKLRDSGTAVTPVGVQQDGTLKVKHQDGTVSVLVADYLW